MTPRTDVLPPAPNADKFRIFHVDETAKPDKEYPLDDGIATCVVHCINLCLDMLKQEDVKNVFRIIAYLYCDEGQPWFLQDPDSDANLNDHTEDFLDIISDSFPYVLVDDSLRNPMTPQSIGGNHGTRNSKPLINLSPLMGR